MIKIILSDRDLKLYLQQGKIKITPFNENLLNPSSIGLRLGYQLRIFKTKNSCLGNLDYINPFENHEAHTQLAQSEDGKFILEPGEFVLASSLEYITLPNNLAARLASRNSISRLGIILLGTAGIIEPGFEGNLTFALGNITQTPIILYPEMHFCSLVFETLTSDPEIPYSQQKKAKYYKQKGPVPSRLHLEKNLKYFSKT